MGVLVEEALLKMQALGWPALNPISIAIYNEYADHLSTLTDGNVTDFTFMEYAP